MAGSFRASADGGPGSGGSTPRSLRSSLTGGSSRALLSPTRQRPPLIHSSSAVRLSSPGTTGSGLPTPPSALTNGSLPRSASGSGAALDQLPGLREPREPRPPASPMGLRRSTTLTRAEGGSGAASPKESLLVPGGGSLLPGSNTDTLFALRKDRSALQQDKSALLLNKRRLEGLLRKMLDGPLAGSGAAGGGGGTDEDCSSPVGSPGPGTGSPLPVLPRGANLRQAVAKALDDSSLLEKQMAAAPAVGAAAFITSAEVDSRVKEMTARMQEMQLDHEVAVSRLEGELSYRKTQAAATIAGLQKQLVDMQEELAQARRQGLQHETSQGQIKELQKEASELRQQVSRLQGALSDRTRQLSDAKDMMGLDRSTVNTLIEMLKEQLRDANATVASRSQRISELEYMVVHRDLLLSQAEDRFVRARAAESARDTAHAAWESVAHTVAAHAAAVGSGGGAFGEHKVTFKTGPGSFSAGKANGSSSGGGGGSGGGHLGMPKPSGALAPYDSYGADAFEDPSDDDE